MTRGYIFAAKLSRKGLQHFASRNLQRNVQNENFHYSQVNPFSTSHKQQDNTSIHFDAVKLQHEATLKTLVYGFKIWSIRFRIDQMKTAFVEDSVSLEKKRFDAIEALKKEINFEENSDYFPFRVVLRILGGCGRFSVVPGRFIRKLRNKLVGVEDDSYRLSNQDCVRELGIVLMVKFLFLAYVAKEYFTQKIIGDDERNEKGGVHDFVGYSERLNITDRLLGLIPDAAEYFKGFGEYFKGGMGMISGDSVKIEASSTDDVNSNIEALKTDDEVGKQESLKTDDEVGKQESLKTDAEVKEEGGVHEVGTSDGLKSDEENF